MTTQFVALRKIRNRFEFKIKIAPEHEAARRSLDEVTRNCRKYWRTRLPMLGKKFIEMGHRVCLFCRLIGHEQECVLRARAIGDRSAVPVDLHPDVKCHRLFKILIWSRHKLTKGDNFRCLLLRLQRSIRKPS